MAFANFDTHEVHCKILYFGAPGSGKTSNLRKILQRTSPEIAGEQMELAPPQEPSFFEFLPVSLGKIREHHLKAHLYILPAYGLYQTLPAVMMKGIDGLIFVADSAVDKLPLNLKALAHTQALLQSQGLMMADVPAVMQYNKRDLSSALPLTYLRTHLNTLSLPDVEAQAVDGVGVMESLQLVVQQFVQQMARA